MKNLIDCPNMMFTLSFSGQQTCYWSTSLSLLDGRLKRSIQHMHANMLLWKKSIFYAKL